MNRLGHLYLSLQEKIQVWHTKLVTKQFEQEKLLLSRTFQKTDVLHYVGCKQNLPTNRLKDWLTNKKFLLSRPWTKVTKICNKQPFQRSFVFHKAQTFKLQFLVKLISMLSLTALQLSLARTIYYKLYECYRELPANIQFFTEITFKLTF